MWHFRDTGRGLSYRCIAPILMKLTGMFDMDSYILIMMIMMIIIGSLIWIEQEILARFRRKISRDCRWVLLRWSTGSCAANRPMDARKSKRLKSWNNQSSNDANDSWRWSFALLLFLGYSCDDLKTKAEPSKKWERVVMIVKDSARFWRRLRILLARNVRGRKFLGQDLSVWTSFDSSWIRGLGEPSKNPQRILKESTKNPQRFLNNEIDKNYETLIQGRISMLLRADWLIDWFGLIKLVW